jgi:hypothetical protein
MLATLTILSLTTMANVSRGAELGQDFGVATITALGGLI